MTNFEKWKSELTPEKVAELLDASEVFIEWANEEVKEDARD